jgi:hypothetical protein
VGGIKERNAPGPGDHRPVCSIQERDCSLVEYRFISLDDEFNPFIYRLQMTISDNHCNFDNLVFESV